MGSGKLRFGVAAGTLLAFVGCSEEVTGPTPVVSGVEPALVCNEQLVTTVDISGDELSPLAIEAATDDPLLAIPDVTLRKTAELDGTPASGTPVTLPNDPENPGAALVQWTSDTSMSFRVTPELMLEPGIYEVTVTNKNGRSATLDAAFAIVPPPSLMTVVPDLVCNLEGDRDLTLTGAEFLVVDGDYPDVAIGDEVFEATAASGCVDVAIGGVDAEICTELSVTMTQASVGLGAFNLVVTNPATAECATQEDVTMALVPEPSLQTIDPGLFCTEEGGVTLDLVGEDFVVAGNALPTVHFGATPIVATSADGCESIAGTTIDPANSCTSLVVDIPEGGVPIGVHEVTVENPDPALCTSNETISVQVVGRPVIDSFEPPAICETAQPAEMTINGEGFLRVSGVDPTVLVDGIAATINGLDGCTPLMIAGITGDICTQIRIAVPGGGFADGIHTVSITNPPPADCSTAADATFGVSAPPTITDVVPTKVCSEGDTFVVNGTGFVPGAEIVLDGTQVITTTFLSDTQVEGTIGPAEVPAGTYDVSVRNGLGCDSNTLTAALIVVDAPFVFFVDPPTVYNNIDLQVTIFASGITDDILSVGIRPTGTVDPLTLLTFTYDPTRPSRVLATVPAGTLAGDYDVVIDDVTCTGEIIDALHVTGTLTVDVASIDPVFGRDDEPTGVTIRSTVPPPAGFVNFAPTPRVYLNPKSGGVASEVQAISFRDPGKLTGVVTGVVIPDVYQLVVINPDGSVGLLDDAFEVVADPPPIITELRPGLVDNQPGQAVQIIGSEFRAPVLVDATCLSPLGVPTAVSATVGTTTAFTIDTTWDLSGLEGHVCVVRVTNTDNGTFADFSAISVTNPSGNLNPFQTDESMLVARRGLAGAAVRMNANSRFLFAIGGDGGAGTDGIASVEAAPVDPFGDVEPWTLQRNALPAGRSLIAGAVIGRHVYVAGGRIGAAPGTVDGDVLRAYLLDPFEAPTVTDLNLTLGDGTGLGGGVWIYRIAAVMGPADSNNPDGEGLPSEPLVVQLPDLTEKVHLGLFWAAVPGAVGYRIYRTSAPDLIAGDERLLVEVAHVGAPTDLQSYTDDGSIDNSAATEEVMPLGSLGTWHVVDTLTTAREGAALVAVPDPNDQDTHYLYVIGGRDAGGTALGSYEWASVSAPAPDVQTVGGFAVGGTGLFVGEERWQLGAVWVNSTRAPVLAATEAFVYALMGLDAASASLTAVTAFSVDTKDGTGAEDGSLGAPIDVNAPGGSVGGGYGYVAGNNRMWHFGAQNAAPSATGRATEICDGGGGCPGGQPQPPGLNNWNAGESLVVPRYLHGTAVESAFIFLLGGETDTEAATASTERTNL